MRGVTARAVPIRLIRHHVFELGYAHDPVFSDEGPVSIWPDAGPPRIDDVDFARGWRIVAVVDIDLENFEKVSVHFVQAADVDESRIGVDHDVGTDQLFQFLNPHGCPTSSLKHIGAFYLVRAPCQLSGNCMV